LIVDAIHGDIHLSALERKVIDTATFQRLRNLKQLGMAQLTYPNATHTRFAHSIGVLGIMEKITGLVQASLNLSEEDVENIRLAGLLHDIGHYPYSHLMERIDKVRLTEELVGNQPFMYDASQVKYPKHEQVGAMIVCNQQEMVDALGGNVRAETVAALFTKTDSADSQLSKLISSSLDMDRLDYLLRDAHAAGVAYGKIDLSYLLNNFLLGKNGDVGVSDKALSAVEHFLLGRFFMHKSVYYHKTTYGMEEACRQLLRRIKDAKKFGIPVDGKAIAELVTSDGLSTFTDSYVDRFIDQAAADKDPLISTLASALKSRKPPKLVYEKNVLHRTSSGALPVENKAFLQACKFCIPEFARKNGIELGRFLVCETPPLTLEKRGALLTESQARDLKPEEKTEIIKIIDRKTQEAISIVDIQHSIVNVCSNHAYQSLRLYFVHSPDEGEILSKLESEVKKWF